MPRRVTPFILSLALAPAALAADHKEAPLIAEDPSADIADIYAFVSPENTDNIVLAMTVNPFSAPTEGINFRFSQNVRYRFEIDLNGDGNPNRSIAVTMNPDQTFRVDLPGNANDFTGVVTQPTLEPAALAPIATDGPNGIRAFAGPRDDPFFFDLVGFNRVLAGTGSFTGSDAFGGFNVSAIVLEIPRSILAGQDQFAVWGATDRRKVTLRRADRGQLERSLGKWQQVERMGNPAVATALIPTDLKDFYNIGTPRDDATDFAGPIVASLQSLGTNDENIGILASVAVPDTLKVDASQNSGYPNGRTPSDDVIDTLFFFIFNQPATPVSDGVQSNDVAFSDTFPYLAAPQQP